MWQDLFAAIGLVLVIEGMMPFISPQRWRDFARVLIDLDDRTLRNIGLLAMLAGASIVAIVHTVFD